MEGNSLPIGSFMQGIPYDTLDLHHHNPMQMPGDSSSMHVNQATDSDQLPEFQFGEPGKTHTKNSMSDDDEEHGDTIDSQSGRGRRGSRWQRMKWTDTIVKLLITAASYIGDDPAAAGAHHHSSSGWRRNSALMQKKGKWKAISKVMGERGYNVSPQQCEDKFNDLNKRYKRLTEILGPGTACKIVEYHDLLDCMVNLSEKLKDDARKILNSKHLFYEEMCSYHNNNRVSLPEDPALQRSLLLALRCRDEHDLRRGAVAVGDADQDDDQSADTDYEQEYNDMTPGHESALLMHKRFGQMAADQEDVGFGNSSSSYGINLGMNRTFSDGTNLALAQKDLPAQCAELEERRFQVQVQALSLAEQRLKWERFSKKKDRELELMRLENEKFRIENKRLELEVRHKELDLELLQKGNSTHA